MGVPTAPPVGITRRQQPLSPVDSVDTQLRVDDQPRMRCWTGRCSACRQMIDLAQLRLRRPQRE